MHTSKNTFENLNRYNETLEGNNSKRNYPIQENKNLNINNLSLKENNFHFSNKNTNNETKLCLKFSRENGQNLTNKLKENSDFNSNLEIHVKDNYSITNKIPGNVKLSTDKKIENEEINNEKLLSKFPII